MKLMIAVPSMDFMHVEFVKSLTALMMHLRDEGVDFKLEIESGTLVYMARDRLACRAINNGFTHVLWLDSDMVFTPELVEDLQFCGEKFVTGIAVSRRKPFSSCLFRDLSLEHLERFGDADTLPREPFEVAGCGLACALTDVEMLRDIQTAEKTCFTPMNGYGEDTAFCRRATAHGYRIFADPSVKVGHIGHLTIYPDDAARYRDEWH